MVAANNGHDTVAVTIWSWLRLQLSHKYVVGVMVMHGYGCSSVTSRVTVRPPPQLLHASMQWAMMLGPLLGGQEIVRWQIGSIYLYLNLNQSTCTTVEAGPPIVMSDVSS